LNAGFTLKYRRFLTLAERIPSAVQSCAHDLLAARAGQLPIVRREQPLAFDAIQTHRRRLFRFVLTAAFAAWVGCADMLATDSAGDSSGSQCARVQSQFRQTRGVLPPQLCRFVPCRSSARTIEVTDEDQETSGEDSPQSTIATPPNSKTFPSAILSFCIAQPDHLIELPGTPPPAVRC
jgi:hypothetical protein